MRYEEKAKLTAARALVPAAILLTSPSRRYLRYVYRDEAPAIQDKEQGRISVHRFVVMSPTSWMALPAHRGARPTHLAPRLNGKLRAVLVITSGAR
ncbi:hypothetical protein [Streptomyces sp. NPDC021608]|uniref:hypothetical protein n=1 Tax=Streptomyces sp. NPDC021608 TaxID=3154903 RepID=UPI0033D13A8C